MITWWQQNIHLVSLTRSGQLFLGYTSYTIEQYCSIIIANSRINDSEHLLPGTGQEGGTVRSWIIPVMEDMTVKPYFKSRAHKTTFTGTPSAQRRSRLAKSTSIFWAIYCCEISCLTSSRRLSTILSFFVFWAPYLIQNIFLVLVQVKMGYWGNMQVTENKI